MVRLYKPQKAPQLKRFTFWRGNGIKGLNIHYTNTSYVKTEYCYFDNYYQTLAFLSNYTNIDNRTLNEIVYEQLQRLTKSLIRYMARSKFRYYVTDKNRQKVLENGYTIKIDTEGREYYEIRPSYTDSFNQIIFSNFTEQIYQDMFSAVCVDFWRMYLDKKVRIVKHVHSYKNGLKVVDTEPIFVFGQYVSKLGNVKSYKYKLFNTLENVLNSYNNHSQSNNGILVNIDSFEKVVSPFLDDDKPNPSTQDINAYMNAIGTYNRLSNNTVLKRQDIQEFFRFCEKDFSRKHIDKMKFVLDCTFNKMTIEQTYQYAQKRDITISRSAIGKIRIELRDLWERYDCKIDIHEYDIEGIITTYHPQTICGKNINYSLRNTSNAKGYQSDKNAVIKYINKCMKDDRELEKCLNSATFVNMQSNYSQYVQSYQNSKELAFIRAINDYCSNIKDTIEEVPFYYSYYFKKCIRNRNYIPIKQNSTCKVIKGENGVYTYYDDKLIRFTPYK